MTELNSETNEMIKDTKPMKNLKKKVERLMKNLSKIVNNIYFNWNLISICLNRN